MPEGPEIRLEADKVHRAVAGRVADEVWCALEGTARAAAELSGRKVLKVDSWGKAMLTTFEGGRVIYSHNQLYGKWYVKKSRELPKTGRSLRLAIHNDKKSALLYSASDIEVLDADRLDEHPFLAKLGPDLLTHGLDA
ncbi:MAG: DNA-formamidopyrimidine glycosylase family protein, partial [Acidobacteriota bacterium]